jgi:acyl-CoA thioesterase FadM
VTTFEYSPEVRWSDQDMLGHVNNARLITLVEECRVRWMNEIRAGHITGGGLLVARQTIDYLVARHVRPGADDDGDGEEARKLLVHRQYPR